MKTTQNADKQRIRTLVVGLFGRLKKSNDLSNS